MNCKVVVFFIFLLVFLSFVEFVYATDDVVVYVYPNIIEKSVNSSFEVEVRIANVVGLYGYELKVYFNNSLLQASALTKETFFPDSNIFEFKKEINNSFGYVWYAVSLLNPETPKSGSGSLIKVTFNSLNVEGNSSLALKDIILGDVNANVIEFVSSDGQVIITKNATFPPSTIPPTYPSITSVKFDIIAVTTSSHVFYEFPFTLKRAVTTTFIVQPTPLASITIGADAIVNWWIVKNGTGRAVLNQTLTVYCTTDEPKSVTVKYSVPEGEYTFYAKVISFGSYEVEENLSSVHFSVGNLVYDWLFVEKNVLFFLIIGIVVMILIWKVLKH